MKSRLAITFILATGLLMSGAGATVAVTGIAGDGPAAVSQYSAPGGDTLGEDQQGGTAPDDESGDDGGGTLGEEQGGGGGTAGAEAGDQVAAADDSLPFTGLVVFPLLIGGVALVATGTILRRKV